jgi:hypothetical protein
LFFFFVHVCFQFPLFPLPMVFFFSIIHFFKKIYVFCLHFFSWLLGYCCFCDCCASLTMQHFGYKKLHYDLNSHCSFVFNRLFLFVDVCITFLGVHRNNNIFGNFCKTFVCLNFFHHWPWARVKNGRVKSKSKLKNAKWKSSNVHKWN